MLNESQIYTKQVAAAEHIDTAIACFFENKFACAITLACAAEGMIPKTENPFLYTNLMGKALEQGILNMNDVVNQERDWLKHHNAKHQNQFNIDQEKTLYDILRGQTKYYAVYGSQTENMDKFESWVRANSNIHLDDKSV